jgi:NTE family protein
MAVARRATTTGALRRPLSSGPSPRGAARRPRIGIALAGGGPLGAIYEIGALCALDEAVPALRPADAQAFVGVSAGAFIAAGLANGMTPQALCDAFIRNTAHTDELFEPDVLMTPAWGEFAARLATLPPAVAAAAWGWLFDRRSVSAAIERIGAALPTGLLSNERLERQLRSAFSQPGRTNDFRALKRRLVIVATELDTGTSAPFGLPGHDTVPISVAVQASAALPGLYTPVAIGGRHYVDGALKKTLHASVLLDEGLDLLLCINPLVPFDAGAPGAHRVGRHGGPRIPKLVDRGLPAVLSQTFRTLIHSRLEIGLKAYERSHPQTDILLFEPDHRDAELFFTNTFGYSQRRHIAEHAYQRTREWLRSHRHAVGATLARHGLAIDDAVLADPQRRLVADGPAALQAPLARALRRLEGVLDDLQAAVAPA